MSSQQPVQIELYCLRHRHPIFAGPTSLASPWLPASKAMMSLRVPMAATGLQRRCREGYFGDSNKEKKNSTHVLLDLRWCSSKSLLMFFLISAAILNKFCWRTQCFFSWLSLLKLLSMISTDVSLLSKTSRSTAWTSRTGRRLWLFYLERTASTFPCCWLGLMWWWGRMTVFLFTKPGCIAVLPSWSKRKKKRLIWKSKTGHMTSVSLPEHQDLTPDSHLHIPTHTHPELWQLLPVYDHIGWQSRHCETEF